MKHMKFFPLAAVLLCPLLATAQLAVTVSPPKVTGQKTVVTLAMKNNLTEKVESARAVIFLLNEQGAMVGQSTKWVIGGIKTRPALEPKTGNDVQFRHYQPATAYQHKLNCQSELQPGGVGR